MKEIKKYISLLAQETAEKLGYLFLECSIRGDQRQSIVEIFIDSANGVTAEDCAKFSRMLGELVEEKELIKTKYRLDISSPGVEKPLRYLEQFNKHINRKFEIEATVEGELKKISGKLVEINNSRLKFNLGKEEIELDYADIKSAKVIISF